MLKRDVDVHKLLQEDPDGFIDYQISLGKHHNKLPADFQIDEASRMQIKKRIMKEDDDIGHTIRVIAFLEGYAWGVNSKE